MARPATAAVRLLTGEREPVRLATIANITLYGLQTIDGVAAEVGDRVLVKDQADQAQNGIYTASEGQWFRAADARTARTMQKGTTVHVQEGAVSADRVYAFETLDPVIGADPIVLSFYLSQDTLGDAVNAASAAAASAAAALTSKNAAATSVTNAAGSATAASGSASAASTSAANAATSATNAGTSATAAAGSASTAAGSATSAGTSASAAAGSASAASGSATTASGSATSAATSATNAAASAVAAANAVAALGYTFSTSTADADPGNGTLRLNSATAASATAAYIDNLDSSGATVSGILDTFDDSTNTIKGQLTLRSKASAAIAYVYNVTGPVVDGTGYRKLTLAYVSGAGTLPTSADGIWLIFTRAGDKGADGLGSGDFTGPASSVTDNIVTFAGTTGKAGKDSGIAVGSLVAGPASAAADNIATFNGTTGKLVKDSGVAVGSLVAGPASAATDNVAAFNGTTGKLVKDSGVAVASLATGPASATSGNLPSFNGTGGKALQDSGIAASNLAKLNANNAFSSAQMIGLSTGQAIGVSGSPAANTSGLTINTVSPATGAGAFISFNRIGAYAVNFGLDTDNKLKVGGWSMGAVAYEILNQNNYPTYLDTRYLQSTANNATVQAASGTAITFTGILAGVKEIKIMARGISFAATGSLKMRIGPTGGLAATGYEGGYGLFQGASNAIAVTDAMFCAQTNNAAGTVMCFGKLVLMDATNNVWGWFATGYSPGANAFVLSSAIALSGPLSQISFYESGGSTFDAGTLNIAWSL
ncbi:hypothetical protein RFM41_24435 [Mesorhizobium sp. VK25A]|uniref:Tail fiber protein n=1 Tax=Mesorhizobium vachelliae TaxID=3072309 RepID=A0ABU5A9B3_9HYPH|nr:MULTISPECIES: hypothetical protein [unclassified Mesorhizobium]MDX8534275.1 hypothetical protein [Mesorhizobium sp. VK25D]MDX8546917.1 hypothetical protein [Mesorhizobium sp. VK25A]